MADEDHDIMVTQFQDITGQDVDRSRFYLESSGWDLELALGSFYESDSMEVEDLDAARPLPEAPKREESTKSTSAPTGGASSKPMSSATPASNINTFSSRFGQSKPPKDDESSESEEEGQAFYAGGSEHSGQQILGPKKKDGADFVKHMFKKAREHGAEALDPNAAGGQASTSRSSFTGAGFKLGSNDVGSEMIPGQSKKKDEKPREFVLKMWQNGFSIDDGPLRAYNDQENREFLNDVMMGRIPRELIREARGGEVMVNMEDHKDKPFEAPKIKTKPFEGSGHVLGNIAPTIASAGGAASRPQAPEAALSETEAQKRVNVDTSRPMTNIQIRLADGGRLIAKLNENSTISDLRRYIRLVKPEVPVEFSLHTTFPNKELSDEADTLKDAGVLGAAVLMRAKR